MKKQFKRILEEKKEHIKEVVMDVNNIKVTPEGCKWKSKTLFDNKTSPITTFGDDKSGVAGMTLCYNGFTLIELLVVVLIIGILAAVALPQYQKAVEKAYMGEALPVLRAIANANEAFYLANGRYAQAQEIDLLDIDIPGTKTTGDYPNRIQTKNWVYSPNGTVGDPYISLAQRKEVGNFYYIYILREDPTRFHCSYYSGATSVQKQLCTQLEANGSL